MGIPISIHAPRTGSDLEGRKKKGVTQDISIHAPRTGSDEENKVRRHPAAHFNPRSPHGERPALVSQSQPSGSHFNPRSPHGERLMSRGFQCFRENFNPRSPHGERPAIGQPIQPIRVFQSTLPARGATLMANESGVNLQFQSTLPARGATLKVETGATVEGLFQSTLPARGATGKNVDLVTLDAISIHAPRTGSDWQPALPRRRRNISIHAPRTGSDDLLATSVESLAIFQSTLPARGATNQLSPAKVGTLHFNPRSPHGERLYPCFRKT